MAYCVELVAERRRFFLQTTEQRSRGNREGPSDRFAGAAIVRQLFRDAFPHCLTPRERPRLRRHERFSDPLKRGAERGVRLYERQTEHVEGKNQAVAYGTEDEGGPKHSVMSLRVRGTRMAEQDYPWCELLPARAAPQANLEAGHREFDGCWLARLAGRWFELKYGGLGVHDDLQLRTLDDEREETAQAAHRFSECVLAAHSELEQVKKARGEMFGGQQSQIRSLRSLERGPQRLLHVVPWKARVGIGNQRTSIAELVETELVRASKFAIHGDKRPHDAC